METYIMALALLFAFGTLYNLWVADMERKGHDRGYMSLIVSLGCAVTILVGFFIPTKSLPATAVIFGVFAAAGAPMTAGSIYRHMRNRARDDQATEKDLRDGLPD